MSRAFIIPRNTENRVKDQPKVVGYRELSELTRNVLQRKIGCTIYRKLKMGDYESSNGQYSEEILHSC